MTPQTEKESVLVDRSFLDHVFLDHAVVVLDSVAYEAIIGDPFIQQTFGRFCLRSARSSAVGSYTSACLAGVQTFIEFFDVATCPRQELNGMLVFTADLPGTIEPLQKRLEDHLGKDAVQHELVQNFDANGSPIPFYRTVRPVYGAESPFISTVSEAEPAYFEAKGAQRAPDGRMAREAYLAAVLQPPLGPQHHFRDLQEVTVGLDGSRSEILQQKLLALGFLPQAANEVASEEQVLCGPEGTAIRIQPALQGREGILALRMALRRPVAGPRVRPYGTTTTLTIEGPETAVWRFEPPPRGDRPTIQNGPDQGVQDVELS